MNNWRITFYNEKRERLFAVVVKGCDKEWAYDEAEDMLKYNEDAMHYNIGLSL